MKIQTERMATTPGESLNKEKVETKSNLLCPISFIPVVFANSGKFYEKQLVSPRPGFTLFFFLQ